MIRKFWIIPLIVIGVAAGLVGWSSFRAQPQTASLQQPNPTITPTAIPTQVNPNSIVDATGNARTKQTVVLNWQASGTVGSVNVKTGDKVNAGETLASLDPASYSIDIINAESDMISATVNLQDLQQSKTPNAQAQVNLLNAQKNYTDTLNTQLNLINWTQQPAYADAVRAESAAQTAYDKALGNFNAVPGNRKNNPDKAKAGFALRRAGFELRRAKNGLDMLGIPTQAELDKAAANTALALAQMQDAQRAAALVANGPSASDLAAAKARMTADQQTINTTKIIAPISGTVTQISSKTGDLVGPGSTAIQVDDTSAIYVDLQVSEVDIDKVKLGQPVSLQFDAIPSKTYNGSVVYVSPNGTTTNGAVVYTASVQISNPDASIKPGMTATGTITVK